MVLPNMGAIPKWLWWLRCPWVAVLNQWFIAIGLEWWVIEQKKLQNYFFLFFCFNVQLKIVVKIHVEICFNVHIKVHLMILKIVIMINSLNFHIKFLMQIYLKNYLKSQHKLCLKMFKISLRIIQCFHVHVTNLL